MNELDGGISQQERSVIPLPPTRVNEDLLRRLIRNSLVPFLNELIPGLLFQYHEKGGPKAPFE